MSSLEIDKILEQLSLFYQEANYREYIDLFEKYEQLIVDNQKDDYYVYWYIYSVASVDRSKKDMQKIISIFEKYESILNEYKDAIEIYIIRIYLLNKIEYFNKAIKAFEEYESVVLSTISVEYYIALLHVLGTKKNYKKIIEIFEKYEPIMYLSNDTALLCNYICALGQLKKYNKVAEVFNRYRSE